MPYPSRKSLSEFYDYILDQQISRTALDHNHKKLKNHAVCLYTMKFIHCDLRRGFLADSSMNEYYVHQC